MVKQYVGARYVPKFASPIEWAADTSYEALTIVTFNNASYTSKIQVPPTVGNPANNPKYWALTGNYNAQVEQYRQETENYNAQVEDYRQSVIDLKNSLKTKPIVNALYLDNVINNNVIDANALNNAISTYGRIYIPKGHYTVNGTINVNFGELDGDYATPIEANRGEVQKLHEECNTILDFSNANVDVSINVLYGKLSNIVVYRNDYAQDDNRELIRQGNLQDVFKTLYNNNNNGTCVKLHTYSAICDRVLAYGAGKCGFECGTYVYLSNCHAMMCYYGYEVNSADSQYENLRAQHVHIGLLAAGWLNIFNNLRFDEVGAYGIAVTGPLNQFSNCNLDECYYSAIHVSSTLNQFTNINYRCCLAYPNKETEITADTYDKCCAISLAPSAYGNSFVQAKSTRSNIMDSGDPILNLSAIFGLAGDNINTLIISSGYGTDKAPIIKTIAGKSNTNVTVITPGEIKNWASYQGSNELYGLFQPTYYQRFKHTLSEPVTVPANMSSETDISLYDYNLPGYLISTTNFDFAVSAGTASELIVQPLVYTAGDGTRVVRVSLHNPSSNPITVTEVDYTGLMTAEKQN